NDRNSELTVAKKEGKEEGRIEGKAEGALAKAKESAMRMLEKNFSLNDISEITGLSIEQIKSLKK
ncbi:MAG: hypothetical protein LBJ89_04180, partial [Holosporales bacterium]|nr:hypothetical protein [Holosporales bacterium]